MTTLTLVTPASVATGVPSVVTIGVTVDDSTKPVFSTAAGVLETSKSESGTWTATWATTSAGTYVVTVAAGAATPLTVTITATDGAVPAPTPGQLDLDVAGLITSPASSTKGALATTFVSQIADTTTPVGAAVADQAFTYSLIFGG